jgi:hypothetical protein
MMSQAQQAPSLPLLQVVSMDSTKELLVVPVVTVMKHPKDSESPQAQKLYQRDLEKADLIKAAIREQLASKTCFNLNIVKERKDV